MSSLPFVSPNPDFTQMQCIRAFLAQQPDELSLEKADIILVHQQSTDRKSNHSPRFTRAGVVFGFIFTVFLLQIGSRGPDCPTGIVGGCPSPI